MQVFQTHFWEDFKASMKNPTSETSVKQQSSWEMQALDPNYKGQAACLGSHSPFTVPYPLSIYIPASPAPFLFIRIPGPSLDSSYRTTALLHSCQLPMQLNWLRRNTQPHLHDPNVKWACHVAQQPYSSDLIHPLSLSSLLFPIPFLPISHELTPIRPSPQPP